MSEKLVSAANLTGRVLKGKKNRAGWEVLECLSSSNINIDDSGRSHTYKVKHVENGQLAFLKATDADLVDEEESMVVKLQAVLRHYNFEASISDYCRGNNMDRVCLAIDHGDALVEWNGTKEPVFYLIFELADGDIRHQLFKSESWPAQRKFRLLHQVAVGLSQLHAADVCHNDLKPPNILDYQGEHKVADLGQATEEHNLAPHEWEAIVGDPKYAPPEVLYMQNSEPGTRALTNRLRRSGDLYLLGSVAYFLFSGRMMTPAILDRMLSVHLPPVNGAGWGGQFNDLLPFWRSAYSEEMAEFQVIVDADTQIPSKTAQQLKSIVSQLCEPDPEERGHPLERVQGKRTFGLQRYIGELDVLSHRLH